MQKILQIAKIYPFSTLIIIAIWVVCLIPIGEMPIRTISLGDKWEHALMYIILSAVIIFEYARCHKKIEWQRIVIASLVLPVIMGALVELTQAYLTFGHRSGEMLDWIADSIGSAIASFIGIPLASYLSKGRRGT